MVPIHIYQILYETLPDQQVNVVLRVDIGLPCFNKRPILKYANTDLASECALRATQHGWHDYQP